MSRLLLRRVNRIIHSTVTHSIVTMSTTSTTDIKKSSIYTRKGDEGLTYLFNMQRVSKTGDTFEALGDVDEANCAIGLAKEYCMQANNGLAEDLVEIQSRLLDIGSNLATPTSSSSETQLSRTQFNNEHVAQLEMLIDQYDSQLPPLKNFILPGGGMSSASLHMARPIVRRAERHIVPLIQRNDASPFVLEYMNRLSDFLFVAARFAAFKENIPDAKYKKARVKKEES